MIITNTAFKREIEALGFECWGPRDKLLFCPSEVWLRDFASFLASIRKPPKKESRDCDDYAMWAVYQASEACAAAFEDGHTFIYCTVRLWAPLNGIELDDQSITGHATNLVRTNEAKVFFFEPQNGMWTDAHTAINSGDVTPVNALL